MNYFNHNAYLTGSAYLRYAYLSGKLRTKKLVNPFSKMSRHAPGTLANDKNLLELILHLNNANKEVVFLFSGKVSQKNKKHKLKNKPL